MINPLASTFLPANAPCSRKACRACAAISTHLRASVFSTTRQHFAFVKAIAAGATSAEAASRSAAIRNGAHRQRSDQKQQQQQQQPPQLDGKAAAAAAVARSTATASTPTSSSLQQSKPVAAVRRSRRSSKASTSSNTTTSSDTCLDNIIAGEGEHTQQTGPPDRRRRRQTQQHSPSGSVAVSGLVQLLVTTGLPLATAKRLVTAAQSSPRNPLDPYRLQERVQQLQQLLGPEGAATAIQRFPNILNSRPEVLALHLRQLLNFFGPEAGASQAEAEAHQAGLMARLSGNPQLLAVDVERLVANLYEMGTILQVEDLHAYAYKAMTTAVAQPQTLQQKMRKVLSLLNAQPQQQIDAAQPGVQAERRRTTSSLVAGEFSYQQLQRAARRDHRWLMLSSDALEARFTGLAEALQVPLSTVGHMFLRQPSIINKSTALMANRAAALQQLPGLEPARAMAAIVAFPALLNLKSEVLQDRWRQLQEAAATSEAWQEQLARLPATGLASLLVRSQARYDRLTHLVARGRQGAAGNGCTLQYAMRLSDQKFAEKFP